MALSGAATASRAAQCMSNAVYRDFNMSISMVSGSSSSNPGQVRKFSNRKNYLRQKLLKTLNKPHSNWPISELPHEMVGDFPNKSSPDKDCSSSLEQYAAGGGEGVEELDIQELRVPEVSNDIEIIMNRNVTAFSKGSIFKLGLWFLGAFMFQTICAVWVLGSVDIFHENGNGSKKKDKRRILDVGLNGKDKSKLKLLGMDDERLEGGVFYLDEEDMEKKIEEIQLMAREAREKERLGMEKSDFQSDDNDDEDEKVDFAKSGIEKEVNARLVTLSKTLGNVQEKMSVSFANNTKRDGGRSDKVGKDDLNEGSNVAHMFKKKYKFRGSSSWKTDKPKGFTNSGHPSAPKEAKEDGGVQDISGGDLEKDGEKKQCVEASKPLRTSEKKLVGRGKKKPGQILERVESELNGLKQDRKGGSFETVKLSKANVLEAPAISSKQNLLNQKNSSRGTGNLLSAETEHKTSESGTDFWWLSLPYVLVIFMRRGLNDEEIQGPFCLKRSSGSNSNFSHTVAFEDRGDASNFCYILQTFFSDLGDFSAEIVPLSIKELKEAVESQIINVMVVKKGQLKLYAGQPLPEAEMALMSILEQNLNASGN